MNKGNINNVSEIFLNSKSIVVYGNIGEGKTALVWKILSFFKDKPIYFISYPHEEILKQFGYKNISIVELEDKDDAVIYIDEPQLLIDVSMNKMESIMSKILSLARQRDLCIIISTSDTRLLSPRIESYFETWCIKNCDYTMTKQRSKLRNIIKKNSFISPESFKLSSHELLLHSKVHNAIGKYNFDLIPEWNEHLSKPYKDFHFDLSPKTNKTHKTH